MNYSNKKESLFTLINRLNVKYWHLPFGDTSNWLESDRLLLEKAIKVFHSL